MSGYFDQEKEKGEPQGDSVVIFSFLVTIQRIVIEAIARY